MDASKLVSGQNLLVLKYSTKLKKDIIDQHKALIDKNGYCWYGKIGGITSEQIVYSLKAADNPAIILYTKGKLFLCDFIEMTTDRPSSGYPAYYDEEYIYPSCYFKLKSIDEASLGILDYLIVRSSGRILSNIFSKQCMASTFFVAYEKVEELPPMPEIKTTKRKGVVTTEICKYSRKGICGCRKSVNYRYSCERPMTCICREEAN